MRFAIIKEIDQKRGSRSDFGAFYAKSNVTVIIAYAKSDHKPFIVIPKYAFYAYQFPMIYICFVRFRVQN